MKWKPVLISLIAIALIVPAALYYGSLDWSLTHTTHVENLPLLSTSDDQGEFRVKAGPYEYRAQVAGLQNTGEAVILLHGFPESSTTWLPLMKPLAAAGYRVLAFDQRGYSPGARPGQVADYTGSQLAGDVIAMADALKFEQFHLIGHDWGAGVGWITTFQYPERLLSWTGMAIPHFGVFNRATVEDPEQSKRSQYFSLFRKPMLVEFLMTYAGQKRFKAMHARTPTVLREEYIRMFAEPGAMSAALNWYRALDTEDLLASGEYDREVHTPTLFIWGNKDGVVARSTVEAQQALIKGPYKELELDTGHSLLRDKPESVIAAVLAHLQQWTPTQANEALTN